MQKFNEDTMVATFIKSFCEDVPLPIYPTVKSGDTIVAGCYYTCKNYIIKCLTTGTFEYHPSMQQLGQTIGTQAGTYVTLRTYKFGELIPNISKKYLLNSNYYNKGTHIALGRYLQCLRDLCDVDLLGLYNYFIPEYIDNWHLDNTQTGNYELVNKTDNHYKCALIPVSFNTKYNVFIDASSCIIKAVYKEGRNLVDAKLMTKIKTYTQFSSPFDFSINSTTLSEITKEPSLYILLQIPNECDSSIVIQQDNSTLNKQLTFINDHNIYAFSDKLIQYLSGNVVTQVDTTPTNIEYIKKLLNCSDTYDFWTTDEPIEKVFQNFSTSSFFDVTGYVDSDIERVL